MPTREQALNTLRQGHEALQGLFDRLGPDELVRSATMGSGEWSAKDLMGHVAFWEELALETLAEWRAGRRPPVEDVFAQDGTDAANAGNQARTAAQSLEEVQRRAQTSYRAITTAIEVMSDEDWDSAPPYPAARHPTLGRLLGGVLAGPDDLFDHASAHLPDLTAYVESLSTP